jgi:hypothetical protein
MPKLSSLLDNLEELLVRLECELQDREDELREKRGAAKEG